MKSWQLDRIFYLHAVHTLDMSRPSPSQQHPDPCIYGIYRLAHALAIIEVHILHIT